MNTTCNKIPNNLNFLDFLSLLSSVDEQTVHVMVEVLLLVGVVWIILKKKETHPPINLTKAEEEALISEYIPDSLVPKVSDTHCALQSRVVYGKIGLHININGIPSLNFGSHDYLGFIGVSEIEERAIQCIDHYGVGACGPRGFYGTSVLHLELEGLLAQYFGTEDSILFSYGFAAIASAIPAYAKKDDIVFVDEKCNFSIHQGLVASKSEIKYFKHNNTRDLETILEKTTSLDLLDVRKARKSRRYLIVEGIYVNTGEICCLPDLIRLCKKYKLRIFIDESISFGVLGETGRGVTEYFGTPRADVDLIMGSFEYALASIGGFCVGFRFLIDHLQAAALGYMFSASLPPLLVQATITALHRIKNHPNRLNRLREISNLMYETLNASSIIKIHFTISGDKDSPVHVLTLKNRYGNQDEIIGNILDSCLQQHIAITRAAYLHQTDLAFARACIRITNSVNHTEEHIAYFIRTLEESCDNIFNYENT